MLEVHEASDFCSFFYLFDIFHGTIVILYNLFVIVLSDDFVAEHQIRYSLSSLATVLTQTKKYNVFQIISIFFLFFLLKKLVCWPVSCGAQHPCNSDLRIAPGTTRHLWRQWYISLCRYMSIYNKSGPPSL